MSLGLKRNTVILEPHQQEWEAEGQKTCAKIRSVAGDDVVDVQHVGSTSIKWICAKPIVDIAVAVRSFQDFMKHDEELRANGIIYRKEDIPGQHLYRCGDLDNDIVTHYIHVVISGSDAWNNYINFRDYLNYDKKEASRYEALKKDLFAKFPNDRESYVNGKHDLITELLAKAREWKGSGLK